MALGDATCRSLATVTKEDSDLFIDTVKKLNRNYYSPAGVVVLM
jgi:hypothetical protein